MNSIESLSLLGLMSRLDSYPQTPNQDEVLVWNATTSRYEPSALKTINGSSLIGSGDLAISASSAMVGSWVQVNFALAKTETGTTDKTTLDTAMKALGLYPPATSFTTSVYPKAKVAFTTASYLPTSATLSTGLPATTSKNRGVLVPTGTSKVYYVELFMAVARIYTSNDWGATFSATYVDRNTPQTPSGAGYVNGYLVITTGTSSSNGYEFSYTNNGGTSWGTFNHGYYSQMQPPMQLGPSLFVFLSGASGTNYGVVTTGTACGTGGLLASAATFYANVGAYNGSTYMVVGGTNAYSSTAAVATSWTARTLTATAYRFFAVGAKFIYISGTDSYVSVDNGTTFTKYTGVVPFSCAVQVFITGSSTGALVPNDTGTAFAFTADGQTYASIVPTVTAPTASATVTASGDRNFVQGTNGLMAFNAYSTTYPSLGNTPAAPVAETTDVKYYLKMG